MANIGQGMDNPDVICTIGEHTESENRNAVPEKNDATYRAKQKKKIALFAVTVAACILFAIVGVIGLVMRMHVSKEANNQNVQQSEKSAFSNAYGEQVKI